MKWLSNIRVAYKILCLVLVAALGLAVVSFNGFHALQQSQENLSALDDVQIPAKADLESGHLNMRKIQSAMLEAIATPDASRHQKMKNDLDTKFTADFEDGWKHYKELVKDDAELQDKIAETETSWKAYHDVAERVIQYTIDGDIAAASHLYAGDGIKKLNALKNNLTDLQTFANERTEQIDAANRAASDTSRRFMLIVSLAAFVVLVLAAVSIIREISGQIGRMVSVCERFQNGDFRRTMELPQRGDEFGTMWRALGKIRENLSRLIGTFNDTTEQLAAASEELNASSEQAAQMADKVSGMVANTTGAVAEQQSSVDHSTKSAVEVADSVHKIQSDMAKVTESSRKASDRAEGGRTAVAGAVKEIRAVESTVRESAGIVDKLGSRSQEIGQIVDTITDIAEQTNLLALNAAIEAARAGEQGRGFSVVADEVRKLAEASQEAASRIAELIADIQKDTGAAVQSMQDGSSKVVRGAETVEKLQETFGEITQLIAHISRDMQEMTASVNGVSDDTEKITASIQVLDRNSRQIASDMKDVSTTVAERTASAQEVAKASSSLSEQAQKMQDALLVFKL
ncbi:MAG: methyl-accepting chemotaxis protein [Selenomonadaceae bacterium]|nr:methyl-accepting chemotaxis protein [Selenomonadaceae bacterium]